MKVSPARSEPRRVAHVMPANSPAPLSGLAAGRQEGPSKGSAGATTPRRVTTLKVCGSEPLGSKRDGAGHNGPAEREPGLQLRKTKKVRNANRNERSRGRFLLHDQDMGKTQNHRNSIEKQLAIGGGWRLAVCGGWRRLAADGSWQLVLGFGWRLAVGGWWRLAVGGWRLAVGGW